MDRARPEHQVQARRGLGPGLTAYDFGPTHPMSPIRLDLTARLCRGARPVRPAAGRRWSAPSRSPDEVPADRARPGLRRRRAARVRRPRARPSRTGLGTEDDPAFAGMHEASARDRRRQPRRSPQAVWRGRGRARGQLHRRPAPRDGRAGRAASASTTTSPWRSAGCSTTAPSGWPTSTSTSTTATASRRSSGTTRGC